MLETNYIDSQLLNQSIGWLHNSSLGLFSIAKLGYLRFKSKKNLQNDGGVERKNNLFRNIK